MLTRVAASHLRVGTFAYFAARRDVDGLRTLADFAIARHYPDAATAKRPYRALLDGVVERQARLVAQWMMLGFIHGVMNTDNTSISGETIDYGPCAFMEAYDPATVFSAIDQHGRYAYGNQPSIMLWNLARLAEASLPLLLDEEGSEQAAVNSANEALRAFPAKYEAARISGLRRKLGLATELEGDAELAEKLFAVMVANKADFTLTFRRLCDAAAGPEGDAGVRALFADGAAYDAWAAVWRKRLGEEPGTAEGRMALMRKANPVFIPRNHLVEAALAAATEREDYQPFEELLEVITHPWDGGEEDNPELAKYALAARPEERVSQTFCGT